MLLATTGARDLRPVQAMTASELIAAQGLIRRIPVGEGVLDAMQGRLDRMPEAMIDYGRTAHTRGLEVIIAGAGGAAHLPGMCASQTDLPVLGVPVKSSILSGWDSLLSIVQMPKGVAVGTLAIGAAGAANAGLLAAQILAIGDSTLAQKISDFRAKQTQTILDNPIPGVM